MTKIIKRRQGQAGATPKNVCPKCEKEYLKTAWGQENKKMKRIGQYCPNPACDFIEKDFVELEDEEGELNNGPGNGNET
jgi:hypothetical protein